MNDFFMDENPYVPGTLIRAEDHNTKNQAIEVGFERVQAETDRSLRLPTGVNSELPVLANARASRVIGFDAVGNLELQAAFEYKGNYTAPTLYLKNQVFRDPVTKNLYIVNADYTSASVSADLTAGSISLAIDVSEVELFKNQAASSAAASAVSAGQSAASAAASAVSAGQSQASATASANSASASATSASQSATSASASASSAAAALASQNAAAASAAAALVSQTQAQSSATQALASQVAAGASAVQASAFATSAQNSANASAASNSSATLAASQALSAAELIVAASTDVFAFYKTYPTYADMVADSASIPYGTSLLVLRDETRFQKKVVYQYFQEDTVSLELDVVGNRFATGLTADTFVFYCYLNANSRLSKFDTYALASADLSSFETGDQIIVQVDETKNSRKTIYTFEDEDLESLSLDFTASAYTQGLAQATLLFKGYDDPQFVATPATPATFGRLGEFAVGADYFYFHNGTQWYRTQGVTF